MTPWPRSNPGSCTNRGRPRRPGRTGCRNPRRKAVTYPAKPSTQTSVARLRAGLEALRHCLLETSFNWSSDHHEAASWFSASRHVDPRVATVEAWEAATEKDSLFALEVPWLKTGLTLAQVTQRIFKNHQAPGLQSATAGTLARIIFNQG